jgi:hypothetical protein
VLISGLKAIHVGNTTSSRNSRSLLSMNGESDTASARIHRRRYERDPVRSQTHSVTSRFRVRVLQSKHYVELRVFVTNDVGVATLRPINAAVFKLRIIPGCKLTVVKAVDGNGPELR